MVEAPSSAAPTVVSLSTATTVSAAATTPPRPSTSSSSPTSPSYTCPQVNDSPSLSRGAVLQEGKGSVGRVILRGQSAVQGLPLNRLGEITHHRDGRPMAVFQREGGS